MEYNLKEGISVLIETIVSENDTAKKYDSGTVDVYATPAMVALMESASKSCVEKQLPLGYTTVGIEISIKHIKASPIGMKIKCEAILEKIEGKKLFYKVCAWDEKSKIGEGTHVRYIVNTEEFIKKL